MKKPGCVKHPEIERWPTGACPECSRLYKLGRAGQTCNKHKDTKRSASGSCSRCQKERKIRLSQKPCEKHEGVSRMANGACPECQEEKRLIRIYGITMKDYVRMVLDQNAECANTNCHIILEPGKSLGGNRATGCIDHNHETGEIRGILCSGCNTALGMLREDSAIILGLNEYILGY